MNPDYNSEKNNLKEVQSISFEILKRFKRICEERGLTYYLAYGTLLGAVRHKGFIPWDDDIDVWMPRKDYMYLHEYLLHNDIEDRYKLCTGQYKVVGEWPELLQMKFIDSGVIIERFYGNSIEKSYPWIDIFALDSVRDDLSSWEKEFKRKRFWYQVCRCKSFLIKSKSFYGKMNAIIYYLNKHHLLNHVLNEDKATKSLINSVINENINNDDTKMFFCNAAVYIPTIHKCYFEKEWFSKTLTMLFNGESFAVPEKYEDILRRLYGDYMQLPPIEERKGSHFGEIIKS